MSGSKRGPGRPPGPRTAAMESFVKSEARISAAGRGRRRAAVSSESASSVEEFATPAPVALSRGGRGRGGNVGMTPRGTQGFSQNGSQSQRGRKSRGGVGSELGSEEGDGDNLSVEDLVKKVVQYFLILQCKKVPMKKSEIVKGAMNHQNKDFAEVIMEVVHVLDDVYGCKLVALKADEAGMMQVVPVLDGNTFIVVSVFETSLSELSGIRPADGSKNDAKKGIIRTILNCIYMLNREIDEDYIWQMVTTLECQTEVCPRREDLRKFLKSECVDTMYLNRQEIKNVDGSIFRYTWGVRAELECDKYVILKTVAKSLDKFSMDFRTHYLELIKNPQYKKKMDADRDRGLMDQTAALESGDEGLEELPEIQFTQRKKPVNKKSEESGSSTSSDD